MSGRSSSTRASYGSLRVPRGGRATKLDGDAIFYVDTARRRRQRIGGRASRHSAAAGTVNHPDAEKLALFSMIVGLQEEVLELREELGMSAENPYGIGGREFAGDLD